MTSFVRINAKSPNLQSAGKVISANDYLNYVDSQKLVLEAQKQVEKIIQQAKLQSKKIIDDAKKQIEQERKKIEVEREVERKKGYQKGMEEGKAQIAEQILKNSHEINQHLLKIEKEIADIVIIGMRKVLGSFDDAEVVSKVVGQAFRELGEQQRVTIRVSPELVDHLREAVQKLLQQSGQTNQAVDIIADHRLGSRGCVLESAAGTIDAGVETQLKVFERFIASKMGIVGDGGEGSKDGRGSAESD
ncbi:MAG: type III secretion system stator protein SctL, partial [Candidatus Competibacterales bacterium]